PSRAPDAPSDAQAGGCSAGDVSRDQQDRTRRGLGHVLALELHGKDGLPAIRRNVSERGSQDRNLGERPFGDCLLVGLRVEQDRGRQAEIQGSRVSGYDRRSGRQGEGEPMRTDEVAASHRETTRMRPASVPILMYHQVTPTPLPQFLKYAVTTDAFA